MIKYLFKKRNPFFDAILFALLLLILDAGQFILYVGFFLYLLHEFTTIEEIQISESQISIKNAYKQVFHFKHADICAFGKGLGNSIFYIDGVKGKIVPFHFQSLGELSEKVPEILETLEKLTGKQRGVLYFKRRSR